jgi:hypothetical protein
MGLIPSELEKARRDVRALYAEAKADLMREPPKPVGAWGRFMDWLLRRGR